MTVEAARAVADAVLYEGYLLYPYRASAAKNRSRWQFGVLGPPSAAWPAFAEDPRMAMRCLLLPRVRPGSVTIHLRFLQLQSRQVVDAQGLSVPSLRWADETVLSWDEAVEHEITVDSLPLLGKSDIPVFVAGGTEEEPVGSVGQVVRRRWPLTARLRASSEPDGDLTRLTVSVTNEHPVAVGDKEEAIRHSLLGAHLLIEAHDATFVSMQDPPPAAATAAARCQQERCWPVLAGSDTVLLGAPIILYDHPAVAEQSPGALFDATEIDEILTLRVMTMTDEEKAEARATDPRAAAIVDRCDTLTPAELQSLHGTRLDDTPWWDPATDEPGPDWVLVDGVRVEKGSLVRVHPNRRADAQDLFFAGQVARVTNVVSDVDGDTHVALVLVDDPAADLHDWYGRYFYFAPDELEPLPASGEEHAC
ncbi:hypothetical protein [Paractinoplanes globisporus]|uniref:Uncharacterized protein n=1 Tax=Paractinoplanes globisporus TaxID=113565 RepID=A0ABW6WCW5_9ACTN|nr:hypothetical protein [Actinoplanes globisporus]